MKIVKGKWWLQLVTKDNKQWIHDCVQYNPGMGYVEHTSPTVPNEILNRCYYYVDSKITQDEIKHQEFLAELERLEAESEM